MACMPHHFKANGQLQSCIAQFCGPRVCVKGLQLHCHHALATCLVFLQGTQLMDEFSAEPALGLFTLINLANTGLCGGAPPALHVPS